MCLDEITTRFKKLSDGLQLVNRPLNLAKGIPVRYNEALPFVISKARRRAPLGPASRPSVEANAWFGQFGPYPSAVNPAQLASHKANFQIEG
jgi:hypothetical protein